jgi:DNA invertase Pin-like site-specific DNA recombinase
MIEDLQPLGISFISLGGASTARPAAKLQLHILAALAEFEWGRIRERVMGLQRPRAHGKRLGRPRTRPAAIEIPGGTVRSAAKVWGVSKTTAARRINSRRLPPADMQ